MRDRVFVWLLNFGLRRPGPVGRWLIWRAFALRYADRAQRVRAMCVLAEMLEENVRQVEHLRAARRGP